MRGELRERILAFNRDKAKKEEMANDLKKLAQKIQPVLSLIVKLLPDEVKAILEKYM